MEVGFTNPPAVPSINPDARRTNNTVNIEGVGMPEQGLVPQASKAESVWVIQSLPLSQEALMVFVICMSQFCTLAGYMEGVLLLHAMAQTFGITHPAQLAWLVAGYSLTIGTFILFSGRLGDIFGYKRMFIGGLLWFSLCSLTTGLSAYSNFVLAVFARVLQGMGPAICLPNALAIFGSVYPPGHRKAMVFSFFGAVAPIGGTVGPVISGLIERASWWPWAFWTLCIAQLVLATAGWIVIPPLPKNSFLFRGWKDLAERLDILGATVGTAGLILFLFAWVQAPISGWSSALVIAPLILGLVFLASFAIIESRFSLHPLLPFQSVNLDVSFILIAVACGWATFGIWSFYLIQLFQEVRELSILVSAALWLPCCVPGAMASVITGKLLGPLDMRPATVMAIALVAFIVGQILLAAAPPHQVYWAQIFPSLMIMPFGMDMSFPAATLILSDLVPKQHQGIAASLVNTVVNYGIAIGVGFATVVEYQINNGGDTIEDKFRGFQGALWTGVGLSGMGLIVSLTYLARDRGWIGAGNTHDG